MYIVQVCLFIRMFLHIEDAIICRTSAPEITAEEDEDRAFISCQIRSKVLDTVLFDGACTPRTQSISTHFYSYFFLVIPYAILIYAVIRLCSCL